MFEALVLLNEFDESDVHWLLGAGTEQQIHSGTTIIQEGSHPPALYFVLEGLLGLNVMREFFVQMDYKNQRMQLLPRISSERPNRAYDVEPVVELKVEGAAEVWLGRVRWMVLVRNNGTVPLQSVVPVVKFTDGPTLRGASISEIAPGKVGRSLVEGKASLDGKADTKGHYTLGLVEAYW